MATEPLEHPASDQRGPEDRHRDLDRFLTFVDAVAAIAITLLVLPLADLGSDLADDESVAHLLREHQAQVWSFLLSFVVIAGAWNAQHRVLRPVRTLHPLVARLLLLWTLTLVVLPFATELVAVAGSDPTSKLLYFGAIGVSRACLAGIGEVTRRHPETAFSGAGDIDPLHGWLNVGLLLVATGLSLGVSALGYYPLLLLLAERPIMMVLRRSS